MHLCEYMCRLQIHSIHQQYIQHMIILCGHVYYLTNLVSSREKRICSFTEIRGFSCVDVRQDLLQNFRVKITNLNTILKSAMKYIAGKNIHLIQ